MEYSSPLKQVLEYCTMDEWSTHEFGNRKARARLEPKHVDPRSCGGAKDKADRDC